MHAVLKAIFTNIYFPYIHFKKLWENELEQMIFLEYKYYDSQYLKKWEWQNKMQNVIKI